MTSTLPAPYTALHGIPFTASLAWRRFPIPDALLRDAIDVLHCPSVAKASDPAYVIDNISNPPQSAIV